MWKTTTLKPEVVQIIHIWHTFDQTWIRKGRIISLLILILIPELRISTCSQYQSHRTSLNSQTENLDTSLCGIYKKYYSGNAPWFAVVLKNWHGSTLSLTYVIRENTEETEIDVAGLCHGGCLNNAKYRHTRFELFSRSNSCFLSTQHLLLAALDSSLIQHPCELFSSSSSDADTFGTAEQGTRHKTHTEDK